MKKLITGLAAMAVALSPALAAKTTIEFKRDDGTVNVGTLNGDGTGALADGTPFTYTYDAEANKMCFVFSPEATTCVIYAEKVPEPKVGDAVRYKVDGTDAEGTATVTAITE